MAVISVKGGGGLLGTLGGIATIAGAVTGNPFLAGLGSAMGTADSMMNGGGGAGASASGGGDNSLLGVLGNLLGFKKSNPGHGSMTNENTDISSADKKALINNAPVQHMPASGMIGYSVSPIGGYNYQNSWPNYLARRF